MIDMGLPRPEPTKNLLIRPGFLLSCAENEDTVFVNSYPLGPLDVRALVMKLDCWLDQIGYDPETATTARQRAGSPSKAERRKSLSEAERRTSGESR